MSRAILFLLLAVSIVFFVYANFAYRLPIVLYLLDVLIGVFTVYGVIYWAGGEQNMLGASGFSYLKAIYMSLLPMYSFYVFTRKGWLTEGLLKFWAIVYLGVAIIMYFYNQQLLLEALATGSEQDAVTNNVGYIMVALLPVSVVFRKTPIIQFLFIGICLVFTLFGMKRGAMLTGSLCTAWLLYKTFTSATTKGKIGLFVLILVLLGVLSYGVMYLLSESDYFAYRIAQTEGGSSSGRDFLYRNAIQYLLGISDSKLLLFGAGANATINILGNLAHNDWLEIMINNGMFMAVIYTFYWAALLGLCIKSRKNDVSYIILTSFFIIGFLETLFSMSYNSIPIYLSSVVGFAMALPEMKKHNVRKHIILKKRK